MNDNSTVAAIAFARKLAMQGMSPSRIWCEALIAGWPVIEADAVMIWEQCQKHKEAFRKALGA